MTPDLRICRRLVAQARIAPRQVVLDFACGSGALARAAKRAQPAATVMGVDPDPEAVRRARRTARRAELVVRFDRGRLEELPYGPRTFDRVLWIWSASRLPADVPAAIHDTRRVVRDGGELHLAVRAASPPDVGALAELLRGGGFRLRAAPDWLGAAAGSLVLLAALAG